MAPPVTFFAHDYRQFKIIYCFNRDFVYSNFEKGQFTEPEVHIIEKYFQEVKHCLTITNIQLKKKKEIDLLATSPTTGQHYHIESRISTTFKLREKATPTKGRGHRDGLDYFSKEKFDHPIVIQKIREIFGEAPCHKVLVVWDTQDNFAEIPKIAKQQYGIEIIGLRGIIHEFTQRQLTSGSRDDILRVLELVSRIRKEERTFLTKQNNQFEKIAQNRRQKS